MKPKKMKRYENQAPANSVPDPDFPDYSWTRDGKCWSEARKILVDDPRFGQIEKWIGGFFLKSHPNSNGYYATTLTKDGRHHHVLVHARVARTFLGRTPSGLQISHEDHNKENCALKNLKFRTSKSNQQHSKKARGEWRGKAVRLSPAERELIKELHALGASVVALSKKFTRHELSIRKVLGYKYITRSKK